MPLQHLSSLPNGFFTATPKTILSVFPKPTLISLPGESNPPLFISILLHGNEISGLYALQNFLKNRDLTRLPRALTLFIGNVHAVEKGVRKLDGCADFNRIWRGGPHKECETATQVFHHIKKTGLWAAVDLHNNTGRNPCYSCVAKTGREELHIASLFSSVVIHSQSPIETLCHAFSELCPSVTCECSQPGCPNGISSAEKLLHTLIDLKNLGEYRSPDLKVYESPGRIHIPQSATIDFTDTESKSDFVFPKDYDLWNFKPLPEGHLFGFQNNPEKKIVVLTENKADITAQFFSVSNKEIRVKTPFAPAMLTTSAKAVYDDCLGYILVNK